MSHRYSVYFCAYDSFYSTASVILSVAMLIQLIEEWVNPDSVGTTIGLTINSYFIQMSTYIVEQQDWGNNINDYFAEYC